MCSVDRHPVIVIQGIIRIALASPCIPIIPLHITWWGGPLKLCGLPFQQEPILRRQGLGDVSMFDGIVDAAVFE